MNLESVSREDRILLGVAVVLLVDLVAFPWFAPIPGVNLVATDAPDSFFGLLGFLFVLAFVADLGIQLFAPKTSVPAIGGSRGATRFILAAAAVGCLGLKFLLQISHFSDLGWGFWLAAILAVGLLTSARSARPSA